MANKNFIVTGEGHLIVVNAKLTDTANYTCVAENVASKRFSDPATITVYGKLLFLKPLPFLTVKSTPLCTRVSGVKNTDVLILWGFIPYLFYLG